MSVPWICLDTAVTVSGEIPVNSAKRASMAEEPLAVDAGESKVLAAGGLLPPLLLLGLCTVSG